MANYNNTDFEQGDIEFGRTLRPSGGSKELMAVESAENIEQSTIGMPASPVVMAGRCPNCGAGMDTGADYCETCHSYICEDVCSFCGAHLDEHVAFCPECGNSRDGIMCPDCHTINKFSFCRQCGRPLTDEARRLQAELCHSQEYVRMKKLAAELAGLDNVLPYASEHDMAKDRITENLRTRVLRLLAEDRGEEVADTGERTPRRMTAAELEERRKEAMTHLQEALARMAQKPVSSPVKARNYVMATKPEGVRLAWKCNYKNAMHSSPCGCAKPQLGGEWVVRGHGGAELIKDDNW